VRKAFHGALMIAACMAVAAPGRAADLARGEEVYLRHCARCHGPTGTSTWPGTPNLARREGMMQTDRNLLETLRKGRGAKPGYQGLLSDADILNVIAYARMLGR